jgi:hypothetical protein
LLICEKCRSAFDECDHFPLILPHCGHTLCQHCVADIIADDDITSEGRSLR